MLETRYKYINVVVTSKAFIGHKKYSNMRLNMILFLSQAGLQRY